MTPNFEELLQYWFGSVRPDPNYLQERMPFWFLKNEAVDGEIIARFAPWLEARETGRFEDWTRTARGSLALILLLDQIPRNAFRGQPRAFAYDPQALSLAQAALEKGLHRELNVVERLFVYLPFEHSEDRNHQLTSVALFADLLRETPPEFRQGIQMAYDYAVRHLEVIERFGRYPHRNEILDRASTDEEIAFLREPGSSF